MAPRRFNRYMVALGMGTHPKFARLTDAEFRAHVVGVLAVAAMAPVRGRLLVGALPAEPIDIATAAGVTEKVAEAAMRKLMAVGVLRPDEEHNCLRVHDWDDVNPPPKTDATAAERQARYRAAGKRRPIPGPTKNEVMARDGGRCVRCGSAGDLEYHHRLPVAGGGGNDADNLEMLCVPCHRGGHVAEVLSRRDARNGHADVTPDVTAPEVEGEVEPSATQKNNSLSDADGVDVKVADVDRRLCALLKARAAARNPKFQVRSRSRWLTDMRRLRECDGSTEAEIAAAVEWVFLDEFWGGVIQSPGNLRQHFPRIWDRMHNTNVTPIRGGRESASDLLRAINGGAA